MQTPALNTNSNVTTHLTTGSLIIDALRCVRG
jgi:hypothetical protein